MFWSRNDFFNKTTIELSFYRREVFEFLKIKGYSLKQIEVYLKAYDYFCENPKKFDGATLVKDLVDIPRLDLDAMLHDYHYVAYGIASNFYTKWKADWLYAKGQERKGKGQYSAFSRFVGLTITGIVFVPYSNYKKGNVKAINEYSFSEDYQILIKDN
jgi:hypothetical protein